MIELKDKQQIDARSLVKTRGRTNPMRLTLALLKHVVIGTCAFFAIFAAVEGIFALAHVGEDTVARPDPLLGYDHLENQTVTFRSEGYSRSTINASGFRDRLYAVPKPAGVKRVCVVGDSMTMGLEVPLESTFPKLLERRLQAEGRNIEVLNCGMSGSGTGQQYLGYRQRIAPLQPDVLILAYHLGDCDDNVGGGTNPPRPTFTLENGKQLRIDFHDVDAWLASEQSRFYSSFDWFRRHSRILAVLSKADLDLHQDATYKQLSKFLNKPMSSLWIRFLRMLPQGNWHITESRQIASDLFPQPAGVKPAEAKSIPAAAANEPAISFKSGKADAESELESAPRPQPSAQPDSSSNGRANAQRAVKPVEHGQQDIDLYRGMLCIHLNRMAVTQEIIRRLNNECKVNHCQLVVLGLPAYDNTIMYYRELNELRAQAAKEGFSYLDAWTAYPARGPLDESPYHFTTHFNRAGHIRMSDYIYKQLFNNR